jgi:hypothetical protein
MMFINNNSWLNWVFAFMVGALLADCQNVNVGQQQKVVKIVADKSVALAVSGYMSDLLLRQVYRK